MTPMIVVCGLMMAGAAVIALGQDKTTNSIPSRSTVPKKTQRSSLASTNKTEAANYPVIGHIEKRDRTITIKSGPKGTVYTVKTDTGKILCENASLEQLRAQAPELHEFIKTAVAGKADARLDVRIR
jgi:hypothetical protein